MKSAFKTFNLLIFAILIATITSCTKPKTEGIISVVYLAGSSPVPNATVELTVNGSTGNEGFFLCNEGFVNSKTLTTSGSGTTEKVCFELEAVISVKVTGPNGKTGVGTLNLIKEETTTAIVKIN